MITFLPCIGIKQHFVGFEVNDAEVTFGTSAATTVVIYQNYGIAIPFCFTPQL